MRAGLGTARGLASVVHSCPARLFRSLLPLRSDACEAAEDASLSPCVTPSSLLSVPQLQLPLSLLQRPEAPVLLPQPPCRRVPGVKLSLPQRMSSAQANLQQHPHSPLPRAKLGSAQRLQFSWDF